MLKTIAAILAAAVIAAAITACKQRPWPYLNCVGTEFGNPHVRLVSVDKPTY
jgi:hypothetical protein